MVDGDWVPEAIEAAGYPLGRDGNRDGAPDARQAHVFSVPAVVLGCFPTLAAPDGLLVCDVREATAVSGPPAGDPWPLLKGGVLLYLRLPGKGAGWRPGVTCSLGVGLRGMGCYGSRRTWMGPCCMPSWVGLKQKGAPKQQGSWMKSGVIRLRPACRLTLGIKLQLLP